MRRLFTLIFLLFSCLLYTGCQGGSNQSVVIYNSYTVQKRPFSEITRIQLENDIYGIGPKKSVIIFEELSTGGEFKSAHDFEIRMKGKLSDKMICHILENYSF